MIQPDQALRLLSEAVQPTETVEIPLDGCFRLVLGESVAADRDTPASDRSAMDGFAVRAADAGADGARLTITGEVRAGQSAKDVQVQPGSAVRIFTGATVPQGADSVVMVEHVDEDAAAGTIVIRRPATAGDHVRPRGSDLRQGEVVVAAGNPIRAAEIAAMAAVGHTRVRVHRPPVVGLLSTGDEIVEPDRAPQSHEVRNSNAGMLLAQLRELGLGGTYLGTADDTPLALEQKLDHGLRGDILVVTGGVSVGRYDLVAPALRSLGARILFHKVSVKPGKPILAGKRDGCLVIGLPGNPVSSFTGFAIFVAPVLRLMMGYAEWENARVFAALDAPISVRPGRTTYHLARLRWAEDGLHVARTETTGSADVLSMVRANGFLITPEQGGEFAAGDTLPVLPWPDADPR
jgi:molybdopterin molybdotransferase